MSQQGDYNLANQTGAGFRTELNQILGDIITSNSGPSAPTGSEIVIGMFWYDETDTELKVCTAVSGSGAAKTGTFVVVQTGPIVGDDLDSTAGNGKGARTVLDSSTTPTGGASGDIVYQYDTDT